MSPESAPKPISMVAGRQPITALLEAADLGPAGACAQLVEQGRVAVNGQTVRHATYRADPQHDALMLDNHKLVYRYVCRYVAFHKPYQVLSCFTDPEGRETVANYMDVPDIYAVGRLDYDSEGLLILTDDGWFNHRLAHPDFEHPKTYWVQVERIPDEQDLKKLGQGIVIKGQKTLPAQARLLFGDQEPPIAPRSVPIRYRKNVPTAWIEIILREGRKRQIRHMTAAIGYPTLRLIRTAIGPVSLGSLAAGEWRNLSAEELDQLSQMLRRTGGNRARSRGGQHRGRYTSGR